MDGLLGRIKAEAVDTAWGNNMEFVIGFVIGVLAHWAWGKWGPLGG
jgi:hypothetical protein